MIFHITEKDRKNLWSKNYIYLRKKLDVVIDWIITFFLREKT